MKFHKISPSSDQSPRRLRFTIATLLIVVTVLCLSFGLLGVPATALVASWMLGVVLYFVAAWRFNVVVGIFVFLAYLCLLTVLVQAIQVAFH